MKDTRYHKFLRVSATVVAIVLIFDSGLLSPVTKQLSDNTMLYVASGVGMNVSVPESDVNRYSAELSEWERLLSEREAALNSREIATRDFGTADIDYSTYVLSGILLILTVLVVLNYALDWTRSRRLAHYEIKGT